MRTKKAYDALIKKIFETGGLTDEMGEDLKKLQDELDEREGILRKMGASYDIDADEYTFEPTSSDDWRSKYDEMRKKYIDRFFGNEEIIKKEEEKTVIDETEDDDDDMTYDDLMYDEEEK